MSVNQAIKLWSYPTSVSDITALFLKHILGEISAIPWSEQGLNEETNTIQSQLLALNEKGWWTVASQPAVTGMQSDDKVFGWGPRNGFVFQKAFVELFLPAADWKALEKKLTSSDHASEVSFYASNAKGDFVSSDIPNERQVEGGGSTNAVTWGVFPGKEIITPTIIEEVSFRAWAEEAFGIWAEWANVYAGAGRGGAAAIGGEASEKGKESKELIEKVREDVWLVNVIHHGYVEREGLWQLLLS